MIAGPTVTCAVSQVKNLHTGSLSCSWPDSSLACAIASIGKTQISAPLFICPIRTYRNTRSFIYSYTLSFFSRVVYVFGSHVKEPPTDITPTFLTTGVLSTLRQADFVAHAILRESGKCVCVVIFRHFKLALCIEVLRIIGEDLYLTSMCEQQAGHITRMVYCVCVLASTWGI